MPVIWRRSVGHRMCKYWNCPEQTYHVERGTVVRFHSMISCEFRAKRFAASSNSRPLRKLFHPSALTRNIAALHPGKHFMGRPDSPSIRRVPGHAA